MPFHRPSLVRYIRRIDSHPAGVEAIRNIAVKVVDGPFGTQLKAEEYVESGIPLIRVSDVRTGKIVKDGLVYISQEKQADLIRSKVIPNDVILTKAGAILGYAAVFPEELVEGNITSHSVLIRCQDKILPQFLAYFLRSAPGQRQVYRWGNKATRPELNTQEVKRIHVPLLSVEQQQEIIEVMQNGERRSEELLSKAKQLLSSIDDYLLSELGITLPFEPENTIANRIFTAQFRDLTSWRFDARVHRYNFKLSSKLYLNVPLKEVVDINPRTVFRNVHDETILTFVPMDAISDEDGTIVTAQEKAFSENIGYTDFQEGDLLWAKITPCMENGKSAVAENMLNGYGFGSTEYHVLRPKSAKIDIRYLHALLRIKRLRMAATNYFGGSSGHQRVDEAFFRHLEIPLPDMVTQQVLVEHIESRRQEAKSLRSEAETELENAKRRIETLLLGETE